eukprot:EG_transcript_6952
MADPFGKDLDNLRKHMGGGGGGGRRQKGQKEDQKPKFTYVQEREVFVCKNGAPKSESTVIRCGVHDLRSVDDLKSRIADLLYFGKAAVAKVWMDDGVPVHAINLLRDRDILFASIVPDEPFYGDTPKPEAPAVPPTPTPAVVEAAAPSPPKDDASTGAAAKTPAQETRPRPFYQPQLEGDAVGDTGCSEAPTNLLSKYGGEEHFLITDMLVSKPRSIPMSLRPPEEREAEEVAEDPIDACIKQKRKALSYGSTASALLALLQQTAPVQPLEDDLAQLAKPVDPGPAKPVGIVGGVSVDPTPAVQLTKRQQEQLKRQQLKKRAKKKQAKQKKREAGQTEGLSDSDSDSDPTAKTRRLDPSVPGAVPPPKLPDRPYVVLPSTVVGGLAVYDSRPLMPSETRQAKDAKPSAVETGKCDPALRDSPPRPKQQEPPPAPARPAAAYVLRAEAAGPRPPAQPPADSSDEEDEGLGPCPPAPAVGREGAEGAAQGGPAELEGPGPCRPAAAYVLRERDVGPRPPPPGAAGGDSSDEEDEFGPRPPL